jgi:hypothetical protein
MLLPRYPPVWRAAFVASVSWLRLWWHEGAASNEALEQRGIYILCLTGLRRMPDYCDNWRNSDAIV